MNEDLDLTKILKDCPKGTKLYSPIFGDVEFLGASQYEDTKCPIRVRLSDNALDSFTFTKYGKLFTEYDGECMLFPSKYQRDWSKFEVKKPKFDPKTLQPFDKVLIRDSKYEDWKCDIFSNIHNRGDYHFRTINAYYAYCIPYNDDTKHLVGTNEEAPEFYRYWKE